MPAILSPKISARRLAGSLVWSLAMAVSPLARDAEVRALPVCATRQPDPEIPLTALRRDVERLTRQRDEAKQAAQVALGSSDRAAQALLAAQELAEVLRSQRDAAQALVRDMASIDPLATVPQVVPQWRAFWFRAQALTAGADRPTPLGTAPGGYEVNGEAIAAEIPADVATGQETDADVAQRLAEAHSFVGDDPRCQRCKRHRLDAAASCVPGGAS